MDRGSRHRRSLRRRLERQTRISLYGPRQDRADIQRRWVWDDRYGNPPYDRQPRARRSELQMGRWLLIALAPLRSKGPLATASGELSPNLGDGRGQAAAV